MEDLWSLTLWQGQLQKSQVGDDVNQAAGVYLDRLRGGAWHDTPGIDCL